MRLDKKLDKGLTEAGFNEIFCPNCEKNTIAYCHNNLHVFGRPGRMLEEYKNEARCLACLKNLKWISERKGYYIVEGK